MAHEEIPPGWTVRKGKEALPGILNAGWNFVSAEESIVRTFVLPDSSSVVPSRRGKLKPAEKESEDYDGWIYVDFFVKVLTRVVFRVGKKYLFRIW